MLAGVSSSLREFFISDYGFSVGTLATAAPDGFPSGFAFSEMGNQVTGHCSIQLGWPISADVLAADVTLAAAGDRIIGNATLAHRSLLLFVGQ